jgi:glyoxylase-like metal-dependent hydrolase (beta-lactamase superfamily II)
VNVRVKTVPNGRWKENCYLVSDSSEATVIIDPGCEPERVREALGANGRPVAILATHAHYDHVASAAELQNLYEVPFYVHSRDRDLLKYINLYLKFFDGLEPVKIPRIEAFLDEVPRPFVLGDMRIEILETPGHTPGGVCFRLAEHLFSGDTLLRHGVGRLDLPGADPERLRASLRILAALPAEVRVHPGHGPPTTIGEELENNPVMKEALSSPRSSKTSPRPSPSAS